MTEQTATPAEPIEIVRKDTQKIVGYACGKCGVVSWLQRAIAVSSETAKDLRSEAQRHCDPKLCEHCGQERFSHYTTCKECHIKLEAAREQAHYDKAEKVHWTNWIGECFYDDRKDQYHFDLSELEDDCDSAEDWPPWVYACENVSLTLDAADILDTAIRQQDGPDPNEYESVGVHAVARLQKQLDEWLAAEKINWYQKNESLIVLLPPYMGDVDNDKEPDGAK